MNLKTFFSGTPDSVISQTSGNFGYPDFGRFTSKGFMLRFSRQNAELVLFSAFWIIVTLLLLFLPIDRGLQIYNKSNMATMPLGVTLEVLSKALFMYLHVNWLIMGLLVKRRYSEYVLYTVGLILLFTTTETLIEYFLVPHYYPDQPRPGWSVVLSWNLPAYGLEFILYSYIYGFVKAWILNERQKKELAEDKLRTELAFLKAQVNPHFLFNTLNNLFSMAHMDNSPATANGILKLSHIMRYMLHESNVENISLEKEINYIRNYIDLEKLRFAGEEEDDIKIDFQVIGSDGLENSQLQLPFVDVAPMLLIPFVENAFKHGITLQGKCKILIKLQVDNSGLRLWVQNTVNRLRQGNHEPSGLGLENAKRRLALLYPNRHNLEVNETEDLFTVELTLKF